MGKKTPKNSPAKQPSAPKLKTSDKSTASSSQVMQHKSTSQPNEATSENRRKTFDAMEVFDAIPKRKDSAEFSMEDLVKSEDIKVKVSSWDYDAEMKKLMDLLQCLYFVGEHEKAMATFDLLEGIVNEDTKWSTARELLDRVMTINAEIAAKLPHETTPRNVIYKLRKMIIDEYLQAVKQFLPTPDIGSSGNYFRGMAMTNEVLKSEPNLPEGVDPVAVGREVKAATVGALLEYRNELENIPDLIGRQGRNLIFEGDRIITYAFCTSTAELFRSAARHCNYTLYVVESQPLCYGHLLLDALAGSSIEVILIPDCNIAALMPSMTKVIMPCAAVLSDGDLKTVSFGGTIAAVAKMFRKEVYAVAATYQFTLAIVGNTNLSLSPYCVSAAPHAHVGYNAHKFDVTQCDDVFSVVTNSVHIAPEQTPRHLTEMYTPRQEKDDTVQ